MNTCSCDRLMVNMGLTVSLWVEVNKIEEESSDKVKCAVWQKHCLQFACCWEDV